MNDLNFVFPNRLLLGVLCASAVIICGCSSAPKPIEPAKAEPMPLAEAMKIIDKRAEWTAFPEISIPRHPAEIFLKGMTIALDPGHGGTDGGAQDTRTGYKQGPTHVREADINLRVGLLLERLLKDAGVNVIMTRRGDDSIDLHARAEVANNAKKLDGSIGADIFISLHHNAGGSGANFTSVFYHGSVDDSEPDLDLARHVAHGIGDALHTQWAKGSPVLSDFLMYPGAGFGVLRASEVPCILCESSFFTNPAEEQRLRDAGYNLREAYGIYRGLCEWAYQGRPTQSSPIITMQGSQVGVAIELNDGLPEGWWGHDIGRIINSSIDLTLDNVRLPFQFDPKSKLLTAELPMSQATTKPTAQILAIHHANMFKHANWPQRYRLEKSTPESGGAPTVKVEALGTFRAASRPATQPSTRSSSGPTTQRGGRRR